MWYDALNQKSFDDWNIKRQGVFDPLIFTLLVLSCFCMIFGNTMINVRHGDARKVWKLFQHVFILFSAPVSSKFQNCWKRMRAYTDSSNRGRSLTVIVFHVAQALLPWLLHVYQGVNPFHIYSQPWDYICNLKSGDDMAAFLRMMRQNASA